MLITTCTGAEVRPKSKLSKATAYRKIDELLAEDIAICDAISMEVLAGARDEHHLAQLRGLLGRAIMLPTTPADYEHAAALYRVCRRQGDTVRKLVDCLIAAVTIEADAALLHADADFAVLARHTPLRTHPDSNA